MAHVLAIQNSHNASVCEIKDNRVIYFQEAERLNKVKKSPNWSALLHKYSGYNFDEIIFVHSSSEDKQNPEQVFKDFSIKYTKFNYVTGHHFYHACCAFYNSGFKESYVLVADCNGGYFNYDNLESELISLYYFKGQRFKKVFQVYASEDEYIKGKDIFINTFSLGNFYTYVRDVLGMQEEGSVMGLSSYTDETYPINLFTTKFNHFKSVQQSVFKILEQKPKLDDAILCNTIQTELENIISKYVSNLKNKNLCVSGGVFQNTVLNSKLLDISPNLYVDPFCDDAGISMGAALFHTKTKNKLNDLYLGDFPNYTILPNRGEQIKHKDVAKLISNKNIVAIYQGRNELGRRALGNRSFLYDPRDSFAKEKLNVLKNREWFRPAAGTMLHEHRHDWFDLKSKNESSFMSYVFQVKKNNILGITHVDNSCRIQTLKKEQNYHFYKLIEEFYNITGVPILANTSFNLSGFPLVNSVDDAIEVLMHEKNKSFNFIYFPELSKIFSKQDFYD